MTRIGLAYSHQKPHRTNMSRLNNKIRSSHPLNGFLKSLPEKDLEYLFKYFDVKGKKVTTAHLSSKLFGLSPKKPIHTAIKALKANLSSYPPEKAFPHFPISTAPFKGLALHNPNTTCYMNAAINGLANCDVVRQILSHPFTPKHLIFIKISSRNLENKVKLPKTLNF